MHINVANVLRAVRSEFSKSLGITDATVVLMDTRHTTDHLYVVDQFKGSNGSFTPSKPTVLEGSLSTSFDSAITMRLKASQGHRRP